MEAIWLISLNKRWRIICMVVPLMVASFSACTPPHNSEIMSNREKVVHSKDEWKKILSPEQYAVLREKATERPFTGKYYLHSVPGTYVCAGCGNELFSSSDKFDAGCGWPSFTEQIESGAIVTAPDSSHGMLRTEILCARCGGHLGHLFYDGPGAGGKRYCVNSLSLGFKD